MPLPLTVSCFSKIQSGFTSLVPAHPGSPGQRAVKRVCVCVCTLQQVQQICTMTLEGNQPPSFLFLHTSQRIRYQAKMTYTIQTHTVTYSTCTSLHVIIIHFFINYPLSIEYIISLHHHSPALHIVQMWTTATNVEQSVVCMCMYACWAHGSL